MYSNNYGWMSRVGIFSHVIFSGNRYIAMSTKTRKECVFLKKFQT